MLEDQRIRLERTQEEERKKMELVRSRIRLQEAVGLTTAQSRDSYERERLGFIDVNEDIAMAKASLAAYTMDEDERMKQRVQGEKLGQELRELKEFRRKLKEQQIQNCRRYREDDRARKLREDEEEMRLKKEYESRVESERQAMLEEFDNYLNALGDCK
ncbi:unnamed protein product [Echinostoma caproni]|uniref:Meiosis-specific nuclear structural protein 1 n=1 Tax=Echinostoma caproni TaxID=27848 RepID=A0A183ALP5_9TREM|nr:unnamed protein product [Echinostoma caproni]